MSDPRLFRTSDLIAALAVALVLATGAAPTLAGDENDKKADEAKPDESLKQGKQASPYVAASRKSKADPSTDAREQAEAERVITNDDLTALYGQESASDEAAPSAEGEAGDAKPVADGKKPDSEPSAVDQMMQRKALQEEQRKLIAETQTELLAAQEKVRDLERSILAIKNPLLKRPEPPEGEDPETWRGSSGPERVAVTEQALEAANAEVTELTQKLERMRSGSN